MTLEEARRNLVLAAQRNRSYAFLQTGLPYLEQVPDDDELRLLALGQFARLGLIGPALELVEDRQQLAERSPELGRALTALQKQPSGRIDWRELAGRFEGNLTIALPRFEACRAHEQEIRQSFHKLDLFRCRDGNHQLARRVGRGARQWLPGLNDWQASAAHAQLLPDKKEVLCLPFFLEGVGFGQLVRRLYNDTQKMFLSYTPRIHLFEPNVAQLAAWLHLDDLGDILTDERFHLWLGPQSLADFLAFHQASPEQAVPRVVFRQAGWGPGQGKLGAVAVSTLAEECEATVQRQLESIRAKLAQRSDFGYYASRLRERTRQPLRVLAVTSRYTTFLQYSMRDILESLQHMGHQARLVIEPDDHTPFPSRARLLAEVTDFLPDLLLMIDHNRHEYGDTYDFPIPFCNWIQDELPSLFGPGRGRGLKPYDLAIGHITSRTAWASDYPRRQCHYVPVPVNPRTYSNEPVCAADLRATACDVSFVSNLSITPEHFLDEQLARYKQPEIRKLLLSLRELLEPRIAAGNVPATNPQTEGIIQQTAEELGFQIPDEEAANLRRNVVDRLINIFFRHQPLHWAAELGLELHIYGRGWEAHPTLGRFAKGIAENGHHLRTIFQGSRINLQLYPSSGIHQRLLEGLASGGFFLIRGTPADGVAALHQSVAQRCIEREIRTENELWNTPDPQLARDVRELNSVLFAPQRLFNGFIRHLEDRTTWAHRVDMPLALPRYDEVRFGTRAEFERLVSRYLADDAARREIATDQRQAVLASFTYDAVIEDVLEFLADYFAERAAANTTRGTGAGTDRAPHADAPSAIRCR